MSWQSSRRRFCQVAFGLLLSVASAVRGDLQRQANTTLAFPEEAPVAASVAGYTTVNAFPGISFTKPVATTFPLGETNRLYVVQQGGIISVINHLSTTPKAEVFMDLENYLTNHGISLPSSDERGLLSMVFHPNYNQNGYFYLYYSINDDEQHQRLARFQATGTPGNYNAAISANPNTEQPILTIYDEATNHNGGDLAFGADGYLYLSLGDEGGGGDGFNNSRFINKDFWGQMLRLDVDNNPANPLPNAHSQPSSTSYKSAIHAGTYRVPADNPFIGATTWHGRSIAANTVRTEIYATGFRNPFRFSIDAPTGRIFLGDVGQDLWEEVDLVIKGGDYGWSWREGLHTFRPSTTVPPRFPDNTAGNTNVEPSSGFTPIDPIFEYGRSSGAIFGSSVIGGIVYRGTQFPSLVGAYLFGDVYGDGGAIAALRETSPGVWSVQRLTTRAQVVDFGTNPSSGEPVLCSLQGSLYKLSPTAAGTAAAALLSQTGAFSNLATLTPATGVVTYEPNVSFWSDYATKSRWFAIKNTTSTIGYSESGNWTFPTGMVWVKHFDIETTRGNPATRRKLETRFLVKTASGIYGLTYKWRLDQSDADLVAETGLTEAIPNSSPAQTWRYPSRGDCTTCHTPNAGLALSFNTPQMNRTHEYGGNSQNQILALSQAGYFSAPVSGVQNLPAFAAANDETQSLEWRVRSYLSVNCVQCHQPGAQAQGFWDARYTTPLDLANMIDAELLNDIGDSANRFVAPGDSAHSMVLRRQKGIGIPRMPPLATNERDLVNEQLITHWIASLVSRQSLSQWQTTHFGSSTEPNAAADFDADNDGLTNLTEFLTGTDPNAAASAWRFGQMNVNGDNVQIQFTQPANCAALIDASTDLQTWQPWGANGNRRDFPAYEVLRTIIAPADGLNRFFRIRLSAP